MSQSNMVSEVQRGRSFSNRHAERMRSTASQPNDRRFMNDRVLNNAGPGKFGALALFRGAAQQISTVTGA